MTRTGFRCCNLDGKYRYSNQTAYTHIYSPLSYISMETWRTVAHACKPHIRIHF